MGRQITTAEALELLAELGQPVAPSTWRSYVARKQAPGAIRRRGRDPLYDEDDIREWVRTRPGRGTRTDLQEKYMLGTKINGMFLTGEAMETVEGHSHKAPIGYSGSVLYRWSDSRWIACYHRERIEGEGVWRVLTDAEAEQWRKQWLSA